ncbi:MAG: alpha-2-macroglobulin family protein [Candidatus Eremiobacteraeota bacterium]|nr:alpha-2-macroglobulin family protein [Candidatus Eremiobacteraeota bacterium]
MKKALVVLLLVCAGALILSGLASCKKTVPEQSAVPPPPKNVGTLEVVMGVPTGQVTEEEELSTVTAYFNQPMAPLTTVPKDDSTGPMIFDPPLAGKYRWLGTSTLTFTPREPFPNGIQVKATVPAGTKSLYGAALAKEYSWTFETLKPQLKESFPENEKRFVAIDKPFFLLFNMPLDTAKAKMFIDFAAINKKKNRLPVTFTVREATAADKDIPEKWKKENVLVVTASYPLGRSTTYSILLKAGLPGKNATMGMAEKTELTFTTQNPFAAVKPKTKPKINPEDHIAFRFTNPVYIKDLARNLSFSPEVKIPDYYEQYEWDTETPDFYIDFKPQTEYKVTIRGTLKDVFGNTLGKDVVYPFKTTDYDPSFSMAEGNGVIEAKSRQQFPVYFCNIKKVRLKMAKVPKDDVIPVLTYNSDQNRGKLIDSYEVNREWDISLPRNEKRALPITMSEVLGKDKTGIVSIVLDHETLLRNQGRTADSFVQVTNLGVTGKFSPENGVVWVTSLDKGEPVEKAKVEIRDDDNKVLWTGETDRKGTVETKGWAMLGLKKKDRWDTPTLWIFASKDKDLAFINSAWGWGISPWAFNIDYNYNPDECEYQGSLFTERGLYRGGEEVKLKGIFREKRWGKWAVSRLNEVNLRVTDSRGEKVFKKNIRLSPFGSFDRSIALEGNAPTGLYSMSLWCSPPGMKEPLEVASGTFRVEAYETADFKVNVGSTRPDYVMQDTYRGFIQGWYLFGAPMAGEKVSWKFRLTPYDFTPKGYEDYLFGPMGLDYDGREGREDREDGEQSSLLGSGEGKLNREGKIDVSVPLKAEKVTRTMLLTVEGSVTAANRKELSGAGEYLVHKGDFYIGVKPLSSFISAKSGQSIEFITVTPDGKKVTGTPLKVDICRREWHSVRKSGMYGSREWVTEMKDEPVKSFEVKTKDQPVSISFTPEKAGYYVVKAQGSDRKQNVVLSEAGFYASGTDYVSWARSEDNMMELVKDRKEYRPGDKARIIIKSPYEKAKALVTFEREFVMQRKVIDVKGSADVFEFDVEHDDMPNVFVSVLLVQGRVADEKFQDGEDLGKPSFRIGYINIPVASENRKLKVSVKSDRERYKPGDEVEVKLKLENSEGKPVVGEVCLAAADVGVLSLIDYKTPSYYKDFYGSRSLSVESADTRLHIIGQRDYGEKGKSGGGGGVDLASLAMRSNFKATAYWNPTIVTNRQGEATVRFKLPDNLTTFRLMAVAETKDSMFGSGEQEFTVTKPLLLKPSHPRFVTIHDRFQAGVLVFNGTKEQGEVAVQIESQGLTCEGGPSQSISLAPGQEKEVLYTFKAETPGKAKLSFGVRMGSETDGLICEIPVQVPVLTEAVATFNSTEADKAQEKLAIPGNIDPVTGSLSVALSSTAMVGLKGGINYLVYYPYECCEQKLSKIMPALMAQDLVEAFDLSSNLKGKQYRDFIQSYLKALENYQKESGGFSLWEEEKSSEREYLSCYAMYALAVAKEKGYKVDDGVVKKGLGYLKAVLTRQASSTWSLPYGERGIYNTKCFALYDLYLMGASDPSYLALLYSKREKMSLFGQALLLRTLHREPSMKEQERELGAALMNKIKTSPTSAHFEEGTDDAGLQWIYDSNVRTTALLLQAFIECDVNFPDVSKVVKWLTAQQKRGRWGTTQENVYCFSALSAYLRKYEKQVPDYDVKVLLGSQDILDASFKGREMKVPSKEVPMRDLKAGADSPVVFEKRGKGRLYYTLRLKYMPLEKSPCKDEGIAVFKTIEPVDQVKEGEALKAGAVYKVTLSVVTPQERSFVVVDDPLPGGFVVVNTALATEKGELSRKLAKLRLDEQEGLWGSTFDHSEIYDDRVLIFADCLHAGEHRFTYFVRALYFGTYMMPSTKAEQMYEPEVFGYSEQKTVEIK